MGSELISGLLEGTDRGVREARDVAGFLGVCGGGGGAMVSSEELIWSLSSVVPMSEPAGWPQDEQNRALEAIFAPQKVQNMGGRDSTIGAVPAANARRFSQKLSADALNLHGGAVSEDLRDALHHFGGVITHGHHRVCSVLGRVLEQ